MDWNGREGLFREGELDVQKLLDLVEPHFRYRGIPKPPKVSFRLLDLSDEVRAIASEAVVEKMRYETDMQICGREYARLEREKRRLEGKEIKVTITGITP